MYKKMSLDLLAFIEKCPTSCHTAETVKNLLTELGFDELSEFEDWKLRPGRDYFVVRGFSSVIAFRLPPEPFQNYQIVAAHSDSPALKLKPNPELSGGHYVRLNTEKYGGVNYYTWIDRPLSIAGKVVVKDKEAATVRLVDLRRGIAVIPGAALHLNKNANEPVLFNAQTELPLICSHEPQEPYDVHAEIAAKLGTQRENILSSDLFLYVLESGMILGAKEEYICAPRLDDLQCAYAALRGFMAAENTKSAAVMSIFDHEEAGSMSGSGAASTFLSDTLLRISRGSGKNMAQHRAALASGFFISADNAHAPHPNHGELADLTNAPVINGGVVIKRNANMRYTTDALGEAVFRMICERAEVPVQTYANRSDITGGSTLGVISSTRVSVPSVDVGLAQLAMHSAYETAGVKDTMYLARAFQSFYSCHITLTAGGFNIDQS